jgi:CheY-like chemotaxis protein
MREGCVQRKILIVDDEGSVRDLFQEIFTDRGYEVVAAEDGQKALEIARQTDLDVIFLDLKLFGMNGIELCRRIRKERPLSLIYAITGWAALFEIDECREAGFDDYFTKPLKIDTLYRAVEEAFEKIDRWRNRYGTGKPWNNS